MELDGKHFHDHVKDKVRDQRLYDETGWKVFRVTGSEANKVINMPNRFPDKWDEGAQHEIHEFMHNTVDGVVEALKQIYFMPKKHIDLKKGEDPEVENYHEKVSFYNLCVSTLQAHKLADFPVP
ncbi:MAG: hypothetical protein ABI863_09850 [Ginsengibacter sp.]